MRRRALAVVAFAALCACKPRTPSSSKDWPLDGHVVDPAGAVVAGAQLRGPPVPPELACAKVHPGSVAECLCSDTAKEFLDYAATHDWQGVLYGTTDATGHFSIRVPKSTPWLEVTSGAGRALLYVQHDLSGGEIRVTPPHSAQVAVAAPDGSTPAGTVVGSFDAFAWLRLAHPEGQGFSITPAPTMPGFFAFAPGYGVRFEQLFNHEPKRTVHLAPKPKLTGEVFDGARPVANAKVVVDPDNCRHETLTDAEGRFSVEAEGAFGNANLVASAGDRVGFAVASRDAPVHLQLGPNAGPLQLVADTPDGPWSSTRLLLEVTTEAGTSVSFNPTTDAEGKATLPALPPGVGKLSGWAMSVPSELGHLQLRTPRSEPLAVHLTPPERLWVHVIDSAKHPIADATVSTGDNKVPGWIDASGWGHLEALTPGKHHVVVTHPSLGEAEADATFPGEVELTLLTPHVLEVTVSADGKPRAAAQVSASIDKTRRNCLTDARGLCSVAFASAEPLEVDVFGGPELAPSKTSVKLEGPLTRVSVSLAALGGIDGQVSDEQGHPVAKATVTTHRVNPARFRSLQAETQEHTDELGHFHLVSDKNEVLSASALGYQSSPAVEAPLGAPLTLKLTRTGVVSGRLVDEGGQPVARYAVGNEPFVTDDGRFQATRPRAGPLVLTAPGFAPVSLAMKAGAAAVDEVGTVKLAPGPRIHGQVVSLQDGPIAGAKVSSRWLGDWLDVGTSGVDGSFVTLPLTVDKPLKLYVHVESQQQLVEVHEGAPVTVVFGPMAGLQVSVVTEKGKPVVGAHVQAKRVGGLEPAHTCVTETYGGCTISDAVVGSYELKATASGRAGLGRTTLVKGDLGRIELTLHR